MIIVYSIYFQNNSRAFPADVEQHILSFFWVNLLSASLPFILVVSFPVFSVHLNILPCLCHWENLVSVLSLDICSGYILRIQALYTSLALSIYRPPRAQFLHFLIYFLLLLDPLYHCQISSVFSFSTFLSITLLSLSIFLFCGCTSRSPRGTPCRVLNLFIISTLCRDAWGMLKYMPPHSGYKWAGVYLSFSCLLQLSSWQGNWNGWRLCPHTHMQTLKMVRAEGCTLQRTEMHCKSRIERILGREGKGCNWYKACKTTSPLAVSFKTKTNNNNKASLPSDWHLLRRRYILSSCLLVLCLTVKQNNKMGQHVIWKCNFLNILLNFNGHHL